MSAKIPRSTTTDDDAALWDTVVVPRWSTLFSDLLLDALAEQDRPGRLRTVLDVGCGTGHPTSELLRRLGDAGRVIGVDRDAALVDLARRKALDHEGTRVFFKVADVEHLDFGDQVFDAVVGNLVLEQLDDPSTALAEMRRVLEPGGALLLTRPLAGTFDEIYDTFREMSLRMELPALAGRADEAAARKPTENALAARARAAGFENVEVRSERLRLPFESARAMFVDPLVRNVFLPEWRLVAGFERDAAQHLTEVERTLDIYFGGGPLSLTVVAGLLLASRPAD